jgi:hypothetical protein
MARLEARERFRNDMTRPIGELRWEVMQWFDLARQLVAEILELPLDHQWRLPAFRIVYQHRLAPRRVALDQIHRDLRPLDRRARDAEAVREVAKLAGDRTPASGDARLRDARLLAARRLLVDDDVERHHLGEQ